LAKNPKLQVKNTQLAGAINLSGLKAKLSRKKEQPAEEKEPKKGKKSAKVEAVESVETSSQAKKAAAIKAKKTAAVGAKKSTTAKETKVSAAKTKKTVATKDKKEVATKEKKISTAKVKKSATVKETKVVTTREKKAVGVDKKKAVAKKAKPPSENLSREEERLVGPVEGTVDEQIVGETKDATVSDAEAKAKSKRTVSKKEGTVSTPKKKDRSVFLSTIRENSEGLGPVFDKKVPTPKPKTQSKTSSEEKEGAAADLGDAKTSAKAKGKESESLGWSWQDKKGGAKRGESSFDSRGRKRGKIGGRRDLSGGADDEGTVWRRRRKGRLLKEVQQEVIRPTSISVRIPITVKDLASEMKLKASQLVSTLFMQGTVVTLNDILDDETLIQLLGHELGCEIAIDTSEEERIQITSESISEEIKAESSENLVYRPPVVTFMGHVDHGKTSIIDVIRRSKVADGEVGAITQHIGAFTCGTDHGSISIIDTPGHEAFSAMRERGAGITDIAILVIAGDEGMREQTYEALTQAQEAKATIIVAINKSDKPAFDRDKVYRQLADCQLLPEAWGGQTIAVACSATTGEGIKELLEMISLQAEVLELKANPRSRARGTVIESEMVKGLGPMATVLVQNGTLRVGDALVFGATYARVKLMRDDAERELKEAGPSIPVRISGLSALPSSGEEFIVVENEKEAKDIAEKRQEGQRQLSFQAKRRRSVESMMEKGSAVEKKVLPLIIRADVQGSLDAVKTALLKITSEKVENNIISMSVGEISESDVQLAAASKAIILGFHTTIEAHAEPMIKAMGVTVRMHNIIYHAQDDIRELMRGLLDKIAEEQERGQAEVRAIFKSSQLGVIAGCVVADGTISRNSTVRVRRDGEVMWTGSILSLKRFKDDVKEVSKGIECGIVLQGYSDFQEGDQLEAFDVTYREQEL